MFLPELPPRAFVLAIGLQLALRKLGDLAAMVQDDAPVELGAL